ncbi:MAG: YggS family pyridoxal phosphate-dependent enzyme [Candidatus Sumerlaeia bacterium]|nr:YggS family pyridoxal phosphate-dependent enzyme [Candidatus Sumerlaeia bacterium]
MSDPSPVVDEALLKNRWESTLQRLAHAAERSGRTPSQITLVAVSKYRPLEALLAQHGFGQRHFAENRVQEMVRKIPLSPSDCVWHLIGPLQTNKAKYLVQGVQWIHSIERIKVAEVLEKEFADAGKRVNVLIQVNIAGEEQKSGCTPNEAPDLVDYVSRQPHLQLQGLMTMAPYATDPELARPVFRALRNLRDQLESSSGLPLPHLSMGMSGDFEVAVEEGATIVRVGTVLYE